MNNLILLYNSKNDSLMLRLKCPNTISIQVGIMFKNVDVSKLCCKSFRICEIKSGFINDNIGYIIIKRINITEKKMRIFIELFIIVDIVEIMFTIIINKKFTNIKVSIIKIIISITLVSIIFPSHFVNFKSNFKIK